MISTRRHCCLALLLALLIGHASVFAHTATHNSGEAADCELCSSYADASKGLADLHVPEIPRPDQQSITPSAFGGHAQRVLPNARQRAPPVAI